MELFSPIVDFTDTGFMNQLNMSQQNRENNSGLTRMLQSGGQGQGQKATKRSVSETKKKYVASSQNWKCGSCHKELNAWFEVDHKLRLEYGGGNNVENLIALCRECHGRKTAMERM
jgi:5-methylcytosine-specific restriction endonuclease McrA